MPRPVPTTNEIIRRANDVHNFKYDYSLTVYKSWKDKIIIICPKHGVFEQKILKHINIKQGCPKCVNKNVSSEEFISKAIKIHGDLYDYSLVEYKTAKIKVKIICKEHGMYEQIPNNHLDGKGCTICGNRYQDKDIFIVKAKKIHGELYDYSLAEYKRSNQKVKIICKEHGVFDQTSNSHLTGSGCPKCRTSKGELRVEEYLTLHNIIFVTQKRFKNCKNKQPLPFDFYIPKYNTCIEYDGEQHFSPMRRSRSKEKNQIKFEATQLHDQIKTDYCKDKGITLIRIPYTKLNDIENILNNYKFE
jgi:very-short-patch-repair endonuclease